MSSNNESQAGRYILTVYMPAPGFRALGVQSHDHNCSLWERVGDELRLRRYWEFERVSAIKHHYVPVYRPEEAQAFLEHLLAQEGLSMADMSEVYGTHELAPAPPVPTVAASSGLPLHSISHIFSAIALDTEILRTETILALAPDNAPDFENDENTRRNWYAGCVSRQGSLTFFPIESPGPIYLRAKLLFHREEGTLMALATATECAVDLQPADLLASEEYWGGEVRRQGTLLVQRVREAVAGRLATAADRERFGYDPRFTEEENILSATMKLIQAISIAIMERNIDRALAEHDLDPAQTYLALGGGYALNCPTNSHLVERYKFKGFLAPPCANDGGQSLGMSLMAFLATGELERRSFKLGAAYHGRRPRFETALERFGDVIEAVTPLDPERFVDDVIHCPVAYVDGAAEIGPRALGHRSIIGDPRTLEAKGFLNDVKRREWWRPVAPIVLEDRATEWFENARRSPYMLEVFRIREERRPQVPAIAHLDDTARVQTIARTDDEQLYDLIEAFRRRTGIPLLCNTSLNDKGEPIADSAVDAINFCLRRGIGVAYIDGLRVALRENAGALIPEAPELRESERFVQAGARAEIWEEWLSLGLEPEFLFVYARSPVVRKSANPSTPEGRKALSQMARLILATDRQERARVTRHMRMYGPEGTGDGRSDPLTYRIDGIRHDEQVAETELLAEYVGSQGTTDTAE